jgi:drug/metabolite transporter (DMT)-like permease
MTGAADVAVAVSAALAAAGSFGTGVALQHRQVQLSPSAGRPGRLLADLVRRRLWLAGFALAAAAYGLQGLALAFGPLALVAPIVATDLLFALPVAARWARRPMRGQDWAGCALAGAGVAVFLVASPPSSGRSDAPAWQWALAFGAVAVVAAGAAALGMLSRGAARAALIAVAAGVVFGLTAAVTLSLTRLVRDSGLAAILAHWQPWALLVLGTTGMLLSASAYQAGPLAASLPVMDTIEPVSGILIGTMVFGERLAGSPSGLALQLAAAATAAAGIVLLGRSPVTAPASASAAPARSAAGPVRAGDASGPDDLTGDVTGCVGRDRESDSLGLGTILRTGGGERGDADDLARGVHQRSAAIARVDRGAGLDCVGQGYRA